MYDIIEVMKKKKRVFTKEWKEKIRKAAIGRKSKHKEKCQCMICKSKRGEYNGKNNPFYGKKHTKTTKRKLSLADKSYTKTKAFKENVSIATKKAKRKNYGDAKAKWIELYGKEKAEKMWLKRNKTISKRTKGSNNPMYGKPAPKGSGSGWSGYLDNIFFRSIHELSYLYYLIENNITFENAEQKKYGIKYKNEKERDRTYFADYIVGNKIIEIKPEAAKNFRLVKIKQKYAEKWAKKNKMQYSIITPTLLEQKVIIKCVNSGRIKWVGKSLEKYKKLCQN